MSLVHLIIGSICLYLAGMHGEEYFKEKSKKSLYWSIFLVIGGVVNIIAMLGSAMA
jgi:hypothetical protein